MVNRSNRNRINKITRGGKRGFTLVETVVALAVLIMAAAGPLTLAIKNIESASVSQDQVTAFYLAQEGVEYIRNKIDSNVLSRALGGSSDWLDGLGDCQSSSGCYVDVVNDVITTCSTDCEYLVYHEDTGYYDYVLAEDGAKQSIFNRKTQIAASGDEAQIKSTVKWIGKYNTERSFVFYDYVYNWR